MIINKSKTLKYWIIGKHAVEGALNNPDRTKYRLCITEENYEKIPRDLQKVKNYILENL